MKGIQSYHSKANSRSWKKNGDIDGEDKRNVREWLPGVGNRKKGDINRHKGFLQVMHALINNKGYKS